MRRLECSPDLVILVKPYTLVSSTLASEIRLWVLGSSMGLTRTRSRLSLVASVFR